MVPRSELDDQNELLLVWKRAANPELLTNDDIKLLGSNYLELHPANVILSAIDRWNDRWKFFSQNLSVGLLHHNQPLATKMKLHPEETDVKNRWLYLAACYEELPNHEGGMAKTIRHLFTSAFKKIIPTQKEVTKSAAETWALNRNSYYLTTEKVVEMKVAEDYTPKEVADQLRIIIDQHKFNGLQNNTNNNYTNFSYRPNG